MSRGSNLAKNTIILAIGTVLPKLTSFVLFPILTGYLTKENYGIYDLILVLESLLLPTVTLQIKAAAFRFLIEARGDRERTASIITTILVFTLPVSMAALVPFFFAMYKLEMATRVVLCVYLLFDIYRNDMAQITRGLSHNLDYSINAIVLSVSKMLLAILCVYFLRMELFGVAITLCGSNLIATLYLFFHTKILWYIRKGCYSSGLLKEMLSYSWPMVPNSLSAWVMRLSDRLVVTTVMGIAANAVYSVANKLPQLLNIAQTTFSMAWQENASIASGDDDSVKYYSQMLRTFFDLMAGCFGVLIGMMPMLFSVLVHGSYDDAYIQIPILFLAMFFSGLSSYMGGIYVAHKQTRSIGITTAVAAVVNLVVDIGLIRYIGLFAASGSTLVSYIALFVFRIVDVKRFSPITYDVKHIVLVIFVLVAESSICLLRHPWLNWFNFVLGVSMFFLLNYRFCWTALRYIKKKLA